MVTQRIRIMLLGLLAGVLGSLLSLGRPNPISATTASVGECPNVACVGGQSGCSAVDGWQCFNKGGTCDHITACGTALEP